MLHDFILYLLDSGQMIAGMTTDNNGIDRSRLNGYNPPH